MSGVEEMAELSRTSKKIFVRISPGSVCTKGCSNDLHKILCGLTHYLWIQIQSTYPLPQGDSGSSFRLM